MFILQILEWNSMICKRKRAYIHVGACTLMFPFLFSFLFKMKYFVKCLFFFFFPHVHFLDTWPNKDLALGTIRQPCGRQYGVYLIGIPITTSKIPLDHMKEAFLAKECNSIHFSRKKLQSILNICNTYVVLTL